MVAIAETSSAIAELVGALTSSFKSVGDAFQVVFDGARRNPCIKLNGPPLYDATRFGHLRDIKVCLASKCGQ